MCGNPGKSDTFQIQPPCIFGFRLTQQNVPTLKIYKIKNVFPFRNCAFAISLEDLSCYDDVHRKSWNWRNTETSKSGDISHVVMTGCGNTTCWAGMKCFNSVQVLKKNKFLSYVCDFRYSEFRLPYVVPIVLMLYQHTLSLYTILTSTINTLLHRKKSNKRNERKI